MEVPLKLSIWVDTRTKKILAILLRAKKAHDIKDAKHLLAQVKSATWLVTDKGYDANWLHHYCDDLGMTAVIPMRKKGKRRNKNHTLRRRNQQFMNYKRYHRRSIVESIFKSIKTKFGASIASHKISAQRTQAYCRAIAHTSFYFLQRF